MGTGCGALHARIRLTLLVYQRLSIMSIYFTDNMFIKT